MNGRIVLYRLSDVLRSRRRACSGCERELDWTDDVCPWCGEGTPPAISLLGAVLLVLFCAVVVVHSQM